VATFQRTAAVLRAAPTPMIAPVIVWVVETGIPKCVTKNSVIAPPASAQKPCTGVQPSDSRSHRAHDAPAPAKVPNPMAAWQLKITQNGISKVGPNRPCE
jgi:hypothetical protein